MTCPRCSRWNSEDEYRCTKCAARLSDSQFRLQTNGPLALQPMESSIAVAEPICLEAAFESERDRLRIPTHAGATQQTLFPSRDSQRVVSIGGPEPERRPRRTVSTPKRKPVNASYLPQQGILEFVPVTGPQPRRLATSVEARIFCDHPVASISHRLFANLYDLAIIGVMAVLFLAVLYWGCDDFGAALTDPLGAAVIGGAIVILGGLYESLFLALRGETPGMRFAGLRLVDFDGRPVNEDQMLKRILGCVVSMLPSGLGLLWSLVDEESLTWQDHISQTFPTPASFE